MSTAQQVCETYELLERILLHLPLRDLLLSQRICTSFRDLVRRSQNINRALFFSPAKDSVQWHRVSYNSKDHEIQGSEGWKARKEDTATELMLNPFIAVTSNLSHNWRHRWTALEDYGNRLKDIYFRDGEEIGFGFHPPQASMYKVQKCYTFVCEEGERNINELLQSSGGSFADMLLSYPPSRKLAIWYECEESRLVHSDEVAENSEDEGVRFRGFLKVVGAMTAVQRYDLEVIPDGDTRNQVQVDGGKQWWLCPWNVDSITGWEMLRLFLIGFEQFRAEKGCK
ncbi:hypothetical protein LTR85_006582 [Meristemomyces frigidus]|nr:hypothetical protein LTR85_006582 [Meristemomyces frigidus]